MSKRASVWAVWPRNDDTPWPLYSEYEGNPPAMACFRTREEAERWATQRMHNNPARIVRLVEPARTGRGKRMEAAREWAMVWWPDASAGDLDALAALLTERELALQAECDELQLTLDMIHAADMRAIKRWQAEDPEGRRLTHPDRADLVIWLSVEVERIRREAMEQALGACAAEEGISDGFMETDPKHYATHQGSFGAARRIAAAIRAAAEELR